MLGIVGRRPSSTGSGGFTLVEMVIVLALLSLLLVLAVPHSLAARRRAYAAEARSVLLEMKTLQWAHYQQHQSFTVSERALGFTPPRGRLFNYAVPRADENSVVLRARGQVREPAAGIEVQLTLFADGSSRLNETF